MQKWESDHAKPSVDNLIILSQKHNVSLDELLTGCTERVRDEKRRAGVRPDYPSLHPWELYSEELMVEFRQSREEGIDIDEYEELFKAVSHAPGCVYGSVANNSLAKGIVCMPDMFLILFVFGHGKSPFLNNGRGRQHFMLSPS